MCPGSSTAAQSSSRREEEGPGASGVPSGAWDGCRQPEVQGEGSRCELGRTRDLVEVWVHGLVRTEEGVVGVASRVLPGYTGMGERLARAIRVVVSRCGWGRMAGVVE